MNSLFYPKMAAENIRKNGKFYLPYLLTCIGTVMMFYIMNTLSMDAGLENMTGGVQVETVLTLGVGVIAVFAVIFLFYTNSFLMKRRKKELGLFNILGMGKSHIARILFLETLYVAAISLAGGILGGIILSKLVLLLLLRILNFEVAFGLTVSIPSMFNCLVLFGLIFGLILIHNLRQLHLSNPIELLQSSRAGEREPKTKWFFTLFGLICMGAGYGVALSVENPLSAFTLFFLAVILVIFGTYALFTSGSIAVLKLLRKNKSFYYQTKHFTSVSGMIYRMKQNAAGLATICILSTMVLVMLSTTVSLYVGMEDVLNTRYPRGIQIESYSDPSESWTEFRERSAQTAARVDELLKEEGVRAQNELQLSGLCIGGALEGNQIILDRSKVNGMGGNVKEFYFLPLSEYNRVTGLKKTLEPGEVLFYCDREAYKNPEFMIGGMALSVKETVTEFPVKSMDSSNIVSSYIIVVADETVMEEIYEKQAEAYGPNASNYVYHIMFDTEDTEEENELCQMLVASLKESGYSFYGDSREKSKGSFITLYGSLFFLGIFLGLLFTMAAALMIYYKQISEGYEDKERFEIMQKVGMSRRELRSSIKSQVLMVFFLPLLVAGLHMAAAFKMVSKLLALLQMSNTTLFALSTLGTFLVFGLFYGLIYSLTAKTYYRIVQYER